MSKADQRPIIIIRKKKVHAAHHGGAWKVAFADFMTAMFALFLVLWLVNQSSDVKSAIAGYFQDPLGRADEFGNSIIQGEGAQTQTVQRIMITDEIMEVRRDRLSKLSQRLSSMMESSDEFAKIRDHVEITLTDEGLQIELIEDDNGFLFKTGSPTPSVYGQEILKQLGGELGSLDLPIRIEGHTDALPFSGEQSGYTNWELSADRANAARRIMSSGGLGQTQIVQVRAMADQRPKFEDTRSPRNRRVTIVMLVRPELAG